jgi:Rrf2 family protein
MDGQCQAQNAISLGRELDPLRFLPQERGMLSSRAKYALRAALHLAERAPDLWAQSGEIAEQEQVPRKFLETILVQLRDQGIIESRRGAHGGHKLIRDARDISVADIIRIVDGPLALTPCASRTRFRQCSDCVDFRQCRLQPLMLRARDVVADVLEACSLAQLTIKQPSNVHPEPNPKSPEKDSSPGRRTSPGGSKAGKGLTRRALRPSSSATT